ncbi:MAG: hypothetical protein GEU87_02405 [Alphaproteobacteria bacterium]|nr:hypothetical protein [Alphaproteobacteria bacterium]
MPTSQERIIAGIKARNLGELGNRSLESYAGKPQSLKDLIETASKADLAAKKLQLTVQRLQNDLAKEERRSSEQFEAFTSMPRAERQRLKADHLKNFRRELVKNSSDERFAILKEIREHADNMAAVSDLYSSAVHMLVQHNLGGEARSRYYQQIAHAGPTELTTYARRAANLGDRDLAAAVAQRYDSLDSSQRKAVGFSKNDLANSICGTDFVKSSGAFAIARNRFNESLNANRAFESGKTTGSNAVRRALDRRSEGNALDAPE